MKNGVLASSTGNVYGVYDISGGAWEKTSSYYNGNNAQDISNGESFASIGGKSDPYSTVYNSSSPGTISASRNYIYGDATFETRGWHGDGAGFVYSTSPFSFRGGGYSYNTEAGIFFYFNGSGYAYYGSTFRLVLSLL